MFADCLIESGGSSNPRRRWTTLFSIGIQALALALAIIIPMVITQTGVLKVMVTPGVPIFSPAPKPAEVKPQPSTARPIAQEIQHIEMVAPDKIPETINTTSDKAISSTVSTNDSNVCHNCTSASTTVGHAVPNALPSDNVAKPVEIKREGPVRLSIVELGELKSRVQPIYPSICRQMHCSGQVILHAIISKQGTIEQLEVVNNANPMLIQSALQAVRQWRYKPYLLNGEAVEVETQITINFTLGNQ